MKLLVQLYIKVRRGFSREYLPCIPTKLSLREGPFLIDHNISDKKVNQILDHCYVAIWYLLLCGPHLLLMFLRCGPPLVCRLMLLRGGLPFPNDAFNVWAPLYFVDWCFYEVGPPILLMLLRGGPPLVCRLMLLRGGLPFTTDALRCGPPPRVL